VLIAVEDYQKLSKLMVHSLQEFCDVVGKEVKKKGLTEKKLNDLLSEDADEK